MPPRAAPVTWDGVFTAAETWNSLTVSPPLRPWPRQPTRQLRLRRGMLITVRAGHRNALALCYGVWWSLSVECMHAGVTFAVHPEYKAKSKGVGLCNTLTRKRLCLRSCPLLILCQYRYKRKVNHYPVLTVPQFP